MWRPLRFVLPSILMTMSSLASGCGPDEAETAGPTVGAGGSATTATDTVTGSGGSSATSGTTTTGTSDKDPAWAYMTGEPELSPASVAPGAVVTVTIPLTDNAIRVMARLQQKVSAPVQPPGSEIEIVEHTGGPITFPIEVSAEAAPGEHYVQFTVMADAVKGATYDYSPSAFGDNYREVLSSKPGTNITDSGIAIPVFVVE